MPIQKIQKSTRGGRVIGQRNLHARITTPPPFLDENTVNEHSETPTRASIQAIRYIAGKRGFPYTVHDIAEDFKTSESTVKRILNSNTPRRYPDSGRMSAESREKRLSLSSEQTSQIGSYLDECLFEDKGDSWHEIARKALDFDENEVPSERTIRRHMAISEQIYTHKAAVKEYIDTRGRSERIEWAQFMLNLGKEIVERLCWCDEIHFRTGPRFTRHIKRRRGERFKPTNIQYKKDARTPVLDQHDEDQTDLSHNFHVFIIIGLQHQSFTFYETGFKNGKRSARFYIENMLSKVVSEFQSKKLILYQDKDSAHTANLTTGWMDKHGFEYIIAPTASPDMSISETWTRSIRSKFYKQRVVSKNAAENRFVKVWNELDQDKIEQTIRSYRARLHEAIDREGFMTKY
jgi:hypothetical protein